MAGEYERVVATVEKSSSCCSGNRWPVEYSSRYLGRLINPTADLVVDQPTGKSVIVFEATDENGRRFRHKTAPFPNGKFRITSRRQKGASYIITIEGSDPTQYFC